MIRKQKEKRLTEMALKIVELVACENIVKTTGEEISEDSNWALVYRLTHTVNSPECRKNHMGWEQELTETYTKMFPEEVP